MKNIAVVYWSGTGNTEAMANAVLAGVQTAGGNGTLFTPAEFDAASIPNFDALAFGCPAMGAEELEEGEFAPMFEGCLPALSGKRVALFGSYGWGDGQWMREWEDTCRNAGVVLGESVICADDPDEAAQTACKSLGAALAE